MDLEFTAEQTELRSSVRTFLAKECTAAYVRTVVEESTGSDNLWRSMVDLDWPALSIAEELGGVGLGFAEVAVVVEELGAVLAPGPFLATVSQFVPAIREAGDPDQQRRFLRPVAGTGASGALAFTDNPGWWSTEAVSTTAKKGDGGWVVSGTKQAVMAGIDAEEFIVAARVGEGSIGLFVIPSAAVKVTCLRSIDATRPLSTVKLDNVVVGTDRVLGEPGSPDVHLALARTLEEATTALAVETLGTCQSLFGMVLRYVTERHQFGAPIGSFQAVKHKLADLFVAIERARSLCYFAVAAIDEDDPDRSLATHMAKAASDDCQDEVCRTAIQLFGGVAFTWEHDAQLFAKRALASGSLFGRAAEHRGQIARAMGVSSGI